MKRFRVRTRPLPTIGPKVSDSGQWLGLQWSSDSKISENVMKNQKDNEKNEIKNEKPNIKSQTPKIISFSIFTFLFSNPLYPRSTLGKAFLYPRGVRAWIRLEKAKEKEDRKWDCKIWEQRMGFYFLVSPLARLLFTLSPTAGASGKGNLTMLLSPP